MTNKALDDQYKNSKCRYEVFYDYENQTKVTQLRFHLDDDDPEIKNKCLCISKIHFTEPVILFYERHRTIGDKKIIEYYENDQLRSYNETTIENSLEIVKGFDADGSLFYLDKTPFDADDNILCSVRWLEKEEGTFECFDLERLGKYKIIISISLVLQI